MGRGLRPRNAPGPSGSPAVSARREPDHASVPKPEACSLKPAAFVDRDGTIIEEVNYLARPDQVRVLPGARDALVRLRAAGYHLVLVTNQAGVARGYFTEADVAAVHDHLESTLDLHFDAILVCPHHPDGTVPAYARGCDCRKPAPGLLLRAMAELPIDPARSFVVGDKRSDTETGRSLGIPGYLVRTGHGVREGGEWADLAAVVDAVLA